MVKEAVGPAAEEKDPRYGWMWSKIMLSFGYTTKQKDKWSNFLNAEDDDKKKALAGWLDGTARHPGSGQNIKHLYVYRHGGDNLETAFGCPEGLEKKAMYFVMKDELEKISDVQEMTHGVSYGDLSFGKKTGDQPALSPLDQLNRLMKDVYLPLLSNPKNHKNWPEVVVTDLLHHTNNFFNKTQVIVGQTRGQTVLPMPIPEGTDVKEAAADSEVLNTVEGAVIDWTRLIRDVLKEEPDSIFVKDGITSHLKPRDEISFWQKREANLRSIQSQLNSETARKVMEILREGGQSTSSQGKSSFLNPIQQCELELREKLAEASDITKYLKPFGELLQAVEDYDFEAEDDGIASSFFPLLVAVRVIWNHSTSYQTERRIVILLACISNLIVERTREFVDDGILGETAGDSPRGGLQKLEQAIAVMEAYKLTFKAAKLKIEQQAEKPEAGAVDNAHTWKFDLKLIFERYDIFLARLREIEHVFEVVITFDRLEKVDVGGNLGGELGPLVWNMWEVQFAEERKVFAEQDDSQYHPLEVSDLGFEAVYGDFCGVLRDWDKTLGAMLVKAFDEVSNSHNGIKLFDTFDLFCPRPDIHDDIIPKYKVLMRMFASEVEETYEIFNKYGLDLPAQPPIYKNMPPYSGACFWAHGLYQRVFDQYERIQHICANELQTEEGKMVVYRLEKAGLSIDQYIKTRHKIWTTEVENIAHDTLNQFVLKRNSKTQLLELNFSERLIALLREVRYFRILGQDVPGHSSKLFDEDTIYRLYREVLNVIIILYNQVMTTVTEVEKPLIQSTLDVIDAKIADGIGKLQWRSQGIHLFLEEAMEVTRDLHFRLNEVKGHSDEIREICKSWCEKPLLQRKKGSQEPISWSSEVDVVNNAKKVIQTGCERITELCLINHENMLSLDKNTADNRNPKWLAYLKFMNDIVVDGFIEMAKTSLSWLYMHMSEEDLAKNANYPIMSVHLELIEGKCMFTPDMDGPRVTDFRVYAPEISGNKKAGASIGDSVWEIINTFLIQFYDTACLMKRLDDPEPTLELKSDYADELVCHPAVTKLKEDVLKCVNVTQAKSRKYRETTFDSLKFIWEDDKDAALEEFCATGPKDREVHKDDNGRDIVDKSPPTLDEFRKEIHKYKALQDGVSDYANDVVFDFVKIDAVKCKNSIGNMIGTWMMMFINFVKERIQKNLIEVKGFCDRVGPVMVKPVTMGDTAALTDCVKTVIEINDMQAHYTNVFPQMQDEVAMLNEFSFSTDEETVAKLEEYPVLWQKTLVDQDAQDAAIVQAKADEQQNIKKRYEAMVGQNIAAYQEFDGRAPLDYALGVDKAFASLDENNLWVAEMEEVLHGIQDSQSLFGLERDDGATTTKLRNNLVNLKYVWDQCSLVLSQFDDFKKTPWDDINTDALEESVKKFQAEMKTLDKSVRAFDVYKGLNVTINNFLAMLPLVNALRDPAMRDRHWDELKERTGKFFTMSKDFNLGDMMALELHTCPDEVDGVVEMAKSEEKTEKVMEDMRKAWSGDGGKIIGFEFTYKAHPSKTFMFASSEEMTEKLEENMLALQTILGGKNFEHFETELIEWRDNLNNVDVTVNLWRDVQQTWSYLESIFMSSEDIRNQLPEETKLFEVIDKKWKNMMAKAVKVPNVVDCCGDPAMLKTLETLRTSLTVCEKKLNDYLETKRKAFPRFYFVAPADLLLMLSQGTNPHAVTGKISSMTDNTGKLEWKMEPCVDHEGKATGELDTEGNVKLYKSKIAIGMFSKEDEYTEFAIWSGENDLPMSGEVENYLAAFIERMQDSLHYLLDIGVKSYEEKPRLQWILEQNAQIGLTGTQIFWTTEVGNSFDRLEEGNENAMKDFNKKQIHQLKELVDHITGDVSKLVRQSIMTIVTIDVHGRDTVHDLVHKGVENAQSFAWQGQLRHRWDDDKQNCFVNCCDAQFRYQYEYLGNVARLVVTPLTDRCYVTLTQAMHLTMGGAPAGPAGTGKTETTKDLGRGLGMMVYVFNCSDQMDYKSTAQIFKGLSMTGAWGCFDEFNRISVEVLSVVSTQYKSILDAIRVRKERFVFQGEEIPLFLSIGAFITMNPGYAGRTELPESLKVLFRPISMCVPDLELICENMLLASGFLEARMLAKKFIVLYRLCKELLSKQDHYDWALRAIKSVLVVAGMLKRQNPHDAEDVVLMRALRDFNTPKIVYEDTPIFMGLINDLFPGLDPPRQRDLDFEDYLKRVLREDKLQTDDGTILKTMQLLELLDVRHCVFVIGYSKVGKSAVIMSLAKTITIHPRRAVMNADCGQSTVKFLNAKTVTRNELYGIMSLATREWIDGLVPILMRELSQRPDKRTKFIVFDGDIDAEWIESMNTVMDDNKILTLASNERIPLQHWMRNLFQINDLKVASPATVSRGGVLYINETDIGWMPYVTSWLEAREIETGRTSEKTSLETFFDGLDPFIEFTRKNFDPSTPISDFSRAQSVCYLLEGLLTEKSVNKDTTKEVYQLYFVYACVWALGGGLDPGDSGKDQRAAFSSWWKGEYKEVKFPDSGVVFDYYIDEETNPPTFKPWKEVVPDHTFDAEQAVPYVCVSHAENWALYDLMDRLIERRRPVLLIGGAGSGKTVMINQKIRMTMAASQKYCTLYVQMNYFSKAGVIQNTLEGVMEKRTGSIYGPPNQKKMIVFYDDLNLPSEDKYFTQDSIELMRLHLDYGGWYEKIGFTWRQIQDTQPIAAQNPKSGTFFVHGRYQGFFVPFSVGFPQMEVCRSVYSQLFDGVLKEFSAPIKKLKGQLLNATMDIYTKVSTTFLSTAIKFVYNYNLRELSNLLGGLTLVTPEACKNPKFYVSAWMHEVCRVFKDRLISRDDLDLFDTLMVAACKDNFTDASLGEPNEIYDPTNPPVWAHYADVNAEGVYACSKGMAEMKQIISEGLDRYNETYAMMDLVLFEDALIHVTKVTRVLLSPSGNMLMVGVGGSGKQSLSRLAAFMAAFDTFRMEITSGYGVLELREDFKELYVKAGQRNIPVIFLFTDLQILDERFLCLFNDYISCGNIPDIIPKEDIDTVLNAQRGECKSAGLGEDRDVLFNWFIEKTRRNLKMVLCFSPVGDGMRIRSQRFSAIVTGCVIDWFQPWPEEALLSVAANFMAEVPDLGDEEARGNVVKFIAFAQTMMEEVNVDFKKREKRNVYVTPKSFLEFIDFYKKLLARKRENLDKEIKRLEDGLDILDATNEKVDGLKEALAKQSVIVAEKSAATDIIVQEVSEKQAIVAVESADAAVEEEKAGVIKKDVSELAANCERDLAAAEPAIIAAEKALDSLDKASLTELKSLPKPPPDVEKVMAAVLTLMCPKPPIKDVSWAATKKAMAKVDGFLTELKTYDKEDIPEQTMKDMRKYCEDPDLTPEKVKSKSGAAAGICDWFRNIVMYFDIYCDVAPKREKLNNAQSTLAAAEKKLGEVQAKVRDLNDMLAGLMAKLAGAEEDKRQITETAQQTQDLLELANRLVNTLSSEGIRWRSSVQIFMVERGLTAGNALLAAAFVSYCGPFDSKFRKAIMADWYPFLEEKKIPMLERVDPLPQLCDGATIAGWSNEGLPNDPLSIQNGCILTNSKRTPVMIDPQLQGIKWIKTRYEDTLVILRMGAKRYLDTLERAVESGDPVLFENVPEDFEPVLDPVVGKNIIKKPSGYQVQIGDKFPDYNLEFLLFMHTKIGNPHFKPETQAQCTLINFTVTEDGLTDQLLALAVEAERPDLEAEIARITKLENDAVVQKTNLEDDLLLRLGSAGPNILENKPLIEKLEATKATAVKIDEEVAEAKVLKVHIAESREVYRPAGRRGALIYFMMNELWKINAHYQFSLKAYQTVFLRAINATTPEPDVVKRVPMLVDNITLVVYSFLDRGLFVKHKLMASSILCLRIMLTLNLLEGDEYTFLLKGTRVATQEANPFAEFMSDVAWECMQALKEIEAFKKLIDDIKGAVNRWKEWCDHPMPESERMPGAWEKSSTALQRLCILRAMRPDRITYAITTFVSSCTQAFGTNGKTIVDQPPTKTRDVLNETDPYTPVFFFLSPGANPYGAIEVEGRMEEVPKTTDDGTLVNVSLGQGQEVVADAGLDAMHKEGGWVFLQNIHLTSSWLPALEKHLEELWVGPHPDFRVFVSAEPNPNAAICVIPLGIMQNAIKVTGEPPTGTKANMRNAMSNFNEAKMEMCQTKNSEFRMLIFAMCFNHNLLLGRGKFGAIGFSRIYPFNTGDLTISVDVILNYLENNTKIPFEDLRYLVGQIMYGGHITDDWDRIVTNCYLDNLLCEQYFEGGELCPNYPIPPASHYDVLRQYIEEQTPEESPSVFGLHANAEIGFLTNQSNDLMSTCLEFAPMTGGGGGGGGGGGDGGATMSEDDKTREYLQGMMEKTGELKFDMIEMNGRVDEDQKSGVLGPYVCDCLQECGRMEKLLGLMRASFTELDKGLKGELSMNPRMEALVVCFQLDQQFDGWSKFNYISQKGLAQWTFDLQSRCKQLDAWQAEMQVPKVMWVPGTFNPQAFINAVIQSTARKNVLPLDKMTTNTDVLKKFADEIAAAPRDGSYITGLYIEGGRWDMGANCIKDQELKKMNPLMPVIYLKPITVDKKDLKDMYECPVYITQARGSQPPAGTFVFAATLKTKDRPAMWIKAGVAMILSLRNCSTADAVHSQSIYWTENRTLNHSYSANAAATNLTAAAANGDPAVLQAALIKTMQQLGKAADKNTKALTHEDQKAMRKRSSSFRPNKKSGRGGRGNDGGGGPSGRGAGRGAGRGGGGGPSKKGASRSGAGGRRR